MEFIISFFKYSLVLAYIVILVSVPIIVRRIILASRKDKFKCIQCGNCCRFAIISLTDEDIDRIGSEGHKDFVEKTRLGEKKLKRVNGRCVFSVDDKCSIYEIRPKVCREFPFQKLVSFIPYIHEWSCCPGIEELKKSGRNRKTR